MATSPESKLRQMKDAVDDQVDNLQVSIDQIEEQIDEATEQATAIDEAMMDPAAYELSVYLYGKALEFEYSYSYQGFWESDISYASNDSVSMLGYDATSVEGQFVCIQAHTSSSSNEPGAGVDWETYWDNADSLVNYRVNLGAAYNVTSINGWKIQEWSTISVPNPSPPPATIIVPAWVTVYEYLGTGWDGDTIIVQYQDDWDFGCDYLHHPLGVPADGDNSPDCVLRVASGVQSSYGLYPRIASLNTAKTIVTNNQTKVDDSEDVFDRYLED
jgi:hypothetical protein